MNLSREMFETPGKDQIDIELVALQGFSWRQQREAKQK